MSFPRYPNYKDSGVEWLGEVPEGWNITEGKRVFFSRRQIALESDPQLAASQKHGVIPQSLMMELNDSKVMLALKGTDSFRHVEENDFVISLRSFEGGIEHSKYQGCVSPAYTVLQATKPVESGFFRHLFKSGPYVSALQSTTDSLRDGKSISYQQFGAIPIPLPPIGEQQAIATFLDRETDKIDALVAEQESLIALLKEKRQAVISHAVTKGLDPTVPMKDSGIEWLGEVPAHWTVQPLKFTALFRSGGTPDKGRLDYWNGQIPWASAKDLKVENLYDTVDHIADQTIIDGVTSLLPTETVVVVVRGMILARLLPVVTIKVPMAINQDLKALIPKEHVSSAFLAWLLRASEVESLTRLDEAGHGTKALRMDAWGAMKVSLPPKQEQKAIAAFLDYETAKLDDLTSEAQHTIDLLKERRSALISAAVTGKINVRGLVDKEAA